MRKTDGQQEKVRNQLYSQIVGEQLSEVAFVQDYLELHFDGPKLTCYVFPILKLQTETIRIVDSEYRNLLCKYIAQIVSNVDYIENQQLTILFANGCSISLNLDPDNPEIVTEVGIFWDADGGIWVFN